jgi:hypothetical protein
MSNNTDSRSVHTDALATLGTIIDDTQKRDAIHLAVIPMQAKQTLRPGAHLDSDGDLSTKSVGIVDPFLRETVQKGQWFWLVIHPRVITSLRHVWTHPAFGDEPTSALLTSIDKSASETWMRAWAMKHMSEDYYGDSENTLSEDSAYASAIRAGHEGNVGPYEGARDSIDSEWWSHWEAITGMKGDRDTYFSCSC